ncbi:UBX domain-containing protein 4 isoform X2 [Rhinichthys klamathensis goyatoka]|uniref:UBX domain-containing protein 4 isoform X2 n=1 Tax=Rhinichthys klamathensis goyatoka TaxID=3034132 RepID=UPI0024B4AC30|nr:UBX domain-containing protein 4 isoform X2 [Rhinichthys klamathensis goyatoka]
MRWFEGSIPAAIASAKQRKSVFVVVITGSDDQSSQLISSWETESVSDAVENCCVAIRVDAQSETCVQFSQIYPVVCIPSSFFIGENGIPLEVIAGSVPADELKRRIIKVTQMHTEQIEGGETDTERPDQTPVCDSQDASNSSSATSKESLSVPMEEDGASGYVTPGEDKSLRSEDASQPDEPLDARVERLTKKLEERREQKKKAEEENELKKEVERRKMGKEVLDYKKKQEDEKTKRLLDERNREKAEEKAARERVKQQIALDRADRAARYAQNQQDTEATRLAALQARAAEHEAKRDATQRERSAVARIQFRLPDGSSFTNQFPSEARLQEVRQFAAQEVGNRYGQFSLATMFPRREFTAEDLEKSLLELELTPSASIVLLPSSRPSSAVVRSSAGGGVWALLGSLLYPLLAVWRIIRGFLFSAAPPPTAGHNQHTHNTHDSGAGAEPKRDAVRKRVLEKRPEDFKKDGKIYRLRTQEDSEDDNNTWNGNSTQQM